MAKSPAWQRKEGKNPKGGLNAAGRRAYNRQTGGNLQAPVKGAPKSLSDLRRKASFLIRMGSAKGPMKDEKGRPTRLKLSLIAWGHSGDKASAVARGRRLMAQYQRKKEKKDG